MCIGRPSGCEIVGVLLLHGGLDGCQGRLNITPAALVESSALTSFIPRLPHPTSTRAKSTGSLETFRERRSTRIFFTPSSALLTVCQIKRNDAEKRVRAMGAHGWRSPDSPRKETLAVSSETAGEGAPDLERLGRDLIQKALIRRFRHSRGSSHHGPTGGRDAEARSRSRPARLLVRLQVLGR